MPIWKRVGSNSSKQTFNKTGIANCSSPSANEKKTTLLGPTKFTNHTSFSSRKSQGRGKGEGKSADPQSRLTKPLVAPKPSKGLFFYTWKKVIRGARDCDDNEPGLNHKTVPSQYLQAGLYPGTFSDAQKCQHHSIYSHKCCKSDLLPNILHRHLVTNI